MNGRPSTSDVVELVGRREKVGRLLLDLQRFADDLLEYASLGDRQVFNLLVSIGFSLWRAAFLVEGKRSGRLVNQHATEFLDVLLWDNAINFPQDRRTHAFTGGYYVNNACVRLLHVRRALNLTAVEGGVFGRLEAFLNDQWHSTTASPDIRKGWSDCHVATVLSVAKLTERASRDARGRRASLPRCRKGRQKAPR
jgi:hypothetical protein